MFISTSPGFPLQPYIESIWYCERLVASPEKTITLPFCRTKIVFRFSGEYLIKSKHEDFIGNDAWISGHQTSPTITNVLGHHNCMGIVFTTLGWNAFLKIEPGRLADKSVPLSQIFGDHIASLQEELGNARFPNEKIRILERYFMKLMSKPRISTTILDALNTIHQSENEKKVSVNELCKQLKTTRKTLNKHFQKYVGLPASIYLKQLLFNSIIRRLSKDPDERLVETAYEFNFFDQAHFIKQFQSISGITPGQYTQLVKENKIDRVSPNFLKAN